MHVVENSFIFLQKVVNFANFYSLVTYDKSIIKSYF
ncbi:hypothetical protein NTHI1209_00865 [Haemophilus influenzae]|uniref:Uncharacterized protein n=1 Tax=Haemophilus influenzae TaxID=727 RepID=A0A158SWL7_HAEIF|nr:hypothetical protein NTHI1209_00865 [Haemophilus influenzae]